MVTCSIDLVVHVRAVIYYVFVMVICTLSVTESVIVLYIHNRSSSEQVSSHMKPWVSLCLSIFGINIPYVILYVFLLFIPFVVNKKIII